MEKTWKVIKEVFGERERQDQKWGEQNHHPMEWLAILGEEVGEANKAALEAHFSGHSRYGVFDDYRKELIQVAAVAVAAVESLDRAGPSTCRVCGCTDDDCSQCIEAAGAPCYWVEKDLCSRCSAEAATKEANS